MKVTRRGRFVLAVVWIVAVCMCAAGCEAVIEKKVTAMPTVQTATPTVTPSQTPTLVPAQCMEDEACWVGSDADGRRGAELREAFKDAGWKDVGMDCVVLAKPAVVLQRCLEGEDRVMSTTVL